MADASGKKQDKKDKLTPKQGAFVREYVLDFNGTQAAIRAGYAPRSAEVQASRLLRIDKVRDAVKAAVAKAAERAEIDASRVLKEAFRIATSDIRNVLSDDGKLKHPHEWGDDIAAAIASVEVVTRPVGSGETARIEYVHKLKAWDKNSALDKLMRHLGLYNQDQSNGVTININGPAADM